MSAAMIQKFNRFLDRASNFLAHRKGLLPLTGALLVVVNFLLNAAGLSGWFISTDFFLHLGVLLAIIGFVLAWAL